MGIAHATNKAKPIKTCKTRNRCYWVNLLSSKYWWSWMKVYSVYRKRETERKKNSISIFAKVSQFAYSCSFNFQYASLDMVPFDIMNNSNNLLSVQKSWRFLTNFGIIVWTGNIFEILKSQKVALKLIKFLQIFTKQHSELWNIQHKSALSVNRLQFVFANNATTEPHIFLVDAKA